jgi:hypothetical protein
MVRRTRCPGIDSGADFFGLYAACRVRRCRHSKAALAASIARANTFTTSTPAGKCATKARLKAPRKCYTWLAS